MALPPASVSLAPTAPEELTSTMKRLQRTRACPAGLRAALFRAQQHLRVSGSRLSNRCQQRATRKRLQTRLPFSSLLPGSTNQRPFPGWGPQCRGTRIRSGRGSKPAAPGTTGEGGTGTCPPPWTGGGTGLRNLSWRRAGTQADCPQTPSAQLRAGGDLPSRVCSSDKTRLLRTHGLELRPTSA